MGDFSFDSWFEDRFGPRPTDKSDRELQEEYEAAVRNLNIIVELRQAIELWESQRYAAVTAWHVAKRGR